MRKLGRRHSTILVPFAAGCLALGGCSREPERIELRPEGRDPPSVARALSIGGRLDETGDDAVRAVECAAALRLTAQRVGSVAANTGPQGQNLAVWAADLFRDRAVRASGADGSRAATERQIARQMVEKRDDARGQAQLSIACLRSLQAQQVPSEAA